MDCGGKETEYKLRINGMEIQSRKHCPFCMLKTNA